MKKPNFSRSQRTKVHPLFDSSSKVRQKVKSHMVSIITGTSLGLLLLAGVLVYQGLTVSSPDAILADRLADPAVLRSPVQTVTPPTPYQPVSQTPGSTEEELDISSATEEQVRDISVLVVCVEERFNEAQAASQDPEYVARADAELRAEIESQCALELTEFYE